MATVGETLAAERRRKGRSLADVSENTKIRARLLDALEQSEYDRLPSPTYVKGYIQSYARYLEIPAQPLVDQYSRESAGHTRSFTDADRYLSDIPAQTLVPSRDAQHAIPRNVWILMAVVLLVVILALCGLSRIFGGPAPANTTPTAPATSATTTTSPGATAAVATPAAVTTAPATGATFKLRIAVRPGMASWVKVTVDGIVANDGTLLGGEGRAYTVTKSAVLVIGLPRAVVITRDGKPVTVPAAANAQLTLNVTQ